MYAVSSYRSNRPTHKHINKPTNRTNYNTLCHSLARSVTLRARSFADNIYPVYFRCKKKVIQQKPVSGQILCARHTNVKYDSILKKNRIIYGWPEMIWNVHSIFHTHLAEQNIKPVVCHSRYSRVAVFQCLAFQESFKHRRLKYLNEMQLSTSFHFKTLQIQKTGCIYRNLYFA